MKKILILLLGAFAFTSCTTDLEVDAPSFDVKADNAELTYDVGDTVKFSFSGQAHYITFYSGVAGSDYDYRNRTEITGGKPQFRFTSQYGGGGTQINPLKIMVTTDLQGYTKEGVAATQWTDITSRATIATNATLIASGIIDLSDIALPGKPIYIAYKFQSVKDPDRAAGTMIVHNFVAETLTPDGSAIPVATLLTAGWRPVNVLNDATNWTTRSTLAQPDLLLAAGGKNAEPSEDWYISNPLYFTKVPPDTGLPIQSIGTNALTTYGHVYNKAGTYKVTFLASNVTVDEQKSVVKQLTITVK
ncbi:MULTISPECIES: DUF5017 domain-containing protein [Rufibacter]|uniref:DUF5017 domain-containing protein n=1 Tax=Rufibacter quisquiliarum TaxID=1549639 RepID=A0A839GTP0_9BACT|nr:MULTISPECIES: DUF5017 domain-containing protein [Rufibacter]MBA9077151.1 hypothetical protein [Rufibacter quisquiliarum]